MSEYIEATIPDNVKYKYELCIYSLPIINSCRMKQKYGNLPLMGDLEKIKFECVY